MLHMQRVSIWIKGNRMETEQRKNADEIHVDNNTGSGNGIGSEICKENDAEAAGETGSMVGKENKKDKRTELFESMPIPQAVMQLIIPTIVGSLVAVLYNLADTYFVGMLNDPVQNAAVTLVAPVMLAFNAVNNLFGVGSSSMMSRALGAKNYDKCYHSAAFGFYASLFCGLMISVFFTAFRAPAMAVLGTTEVTAEATAEYMKWTVCFGAVPSIMNVILSYMVRSEGAALHATIGTMSGCLLNIVLDPFFILPQFLGMGAAGAGLATFISNCVACTYYIVLSFAKRKTTIVKLHPRYFTLDKAIVLGICAVGVPASIQNLLNVAGMTILNNFTASYGANAVAAMGIAQKCVNVAWYICLGASQGIMPMVSYNYASGDYKRMRGTVGFFLKLMLPAAILIMLFYHLGAEQIIGFFMKDTEVVGYGTVFMRGFCLAVPLICTDFLAVGVFQALGLGQYSLVFAILRKIVLEIPALFIYKHVFGIYGLAYAQPTAELVLCIAAVVMLVKLMGMKKETPDSLGKPDKDAEL